MLEYFTLNKGFGAVNFYSWLPAPKAQNVLFRRSIYNSFSNGQMCKVKKERDKNHTSNNNLWVVAGFRSHKFL